MKAQSYAGAKDRSAADDHITAEIRDENAMSEPGAVATGLFFRTLKRKRSVATAPGSDFC